MIWSEGNGNRGWRKMQHTLCEKRLREIRFNLIFLDNPTIDPQLIYVKI